MTFTIKRKYILGLGNWLASLTLTGQDSRNRTKFIESLNDEVKENELTRLEVLKKYADKDEDTGELKVIENEKDGSKHYHIADDKMPDFQKEFTTFLESDLVIGGEGLKTRLETVKNIVLNPDVKIEKDIASDYDKWCEAFESMTE